VLPIGRGVDLGHQVRGSQCLNFLLHARLHAFEHRAAASKHDVAEKVPPDVTLALHDGVVGVLVDTILAALHLLAPVRGLEEDLGALQALTVHRDCLRAGQSVLLGRSDVRITSRLKLGVEVMSDLTVLLLDLDGDLVGFLAFLIIGEGQKIGVLLVQQHHEVVGQISSANGDLRDEVRQGISLVNGNGVSNTLTRVKDGTSGASRGKQGKDSLVSEVQSLNFEVLKPTQISYINTSGVARLT